MKKKIIIKAYRCPKFGGDAKQTLEIRVERKRNLKLGELGEVSFGIYKLGQLGELSFEMFHFSTDIFISIFSSIAALESPKFAWHHHQTLDTYPIFSEFFLSPS